LISTPKHLALYEAFGWTPPTFAHLGLLVNSDGSKLSKRNDSVNLSTYQAKNVFPMALLSWLANLGSSFKSNVRPPRTVSDISNAVCYISIPLLTLIIC
jgi:glutamyl-tRNA synthetase